MICVPQIKLGFLLFWQIGAGIVFVLSLKYFSKHISTYMLYNTFHKDDEATAEIHLLFNFMNSNVSY